MAKKPKQEKLDTSGLKRRGRKKVTTIEVNRFNLHPNVFLQETITNDVPEYELKSTFKISGYSVFPMLVVEMDKFMKVYEKYSYFDSNNEKHFDKVIVDLPMDLSTIDTNNIVLWCWASHQCFDVEGNELGHLYYFDYIEGQYDNNNYDLKGLKKYLETLPNVYNVSIDEIPYYNAERHRTKSIYAQVYFTGEQIKKIKEIDDGSSWCKGYFQLKSKLSYVNCGLDFFDIDQFKKTPRECDD